MAGAYIGQIAGRAAAGALESYINSMEAAEAAAAATDENEGEKADAEACATCAEPPRPPNRRHDPCRMRNNDPTKEHNTVWDPEYASLVRQDIQAIQSGSVPRVGGTWTVNGRVYGLHGQSLHPISGPGLMNLSRAQHHTLKMLNSGGYRAGMQFAENLISRGLMTRGELDAALEIWKKCAVS
ncbi:hypothetical protein D9M71_246740 [compost metagenome]